MLLFGVLLKKGEHVLLAERHGGGDLADIEVGGSFRVATCLPDLQFEEAERLVFVLDSVDGGLGLAVVGSVGLVVLFGEVQ